VTAEIAADYIATIFFVKLTLDSGIRPIFFQGKKKIKSVKGKGKPRAAI